MDEYDEQSEVADRLRIRVFLFYSIDYYLLIEYQIKLNLYKTDLPPLEAAKYQPSG